jgi:hypothetical protein
MKISAVELNRCDEGQAGGRGGGCRVLLVFSLLSFTLLFSIVGSEN